MLEDTYSLNLPKQISVSSKGEEDAGLDNLEVQKTQSDGTEDDPSELHVCPHCKAFFATAKYLKDHMKRKCVRSENVDNPYKCEHCSLSFKLKSQLSRHILLHTGERPFKCESCEKTFLTKSHLKRHNVIHLSPDKLLHKCDICEKVFAWPSLLSAHKKTHTGEKRFKCGICARMFLHLSSLRTHTSNRHTVNGFFHCVVCKKQFSEVSNLIIHMRQHTEDESVKCERCFAYFSTLRDLETHYCTNFGGKPLFCSLCLTEYQDTDVFCKHSCMHIGTNRKCGCCGKEFKSIWHLKEHLITHTGEKPFQCDQCKTSFRRKRELQIHMTRHNVDKTFVCEFCSISFTSDHYLKQHVRQEHREKKFFCEICQHTFMHRSALKSHMDFHIRTGNKKYGKKNHRKSELLIPGLAEKLEEEKTKENNQKEVSDCHENKTLSDCTVTENVNSSIKEIDDNSTNGCLQNGNIKDQFELNMLIKNKKQNVDGLCLFSGDSIDLLTNGIIHDTEAITGLKETNVEELQSTEITDSVVSSESKINVKEHSKSPSNDSVHVLQEMTAETQAGTCNKSNTGDSSTEINNINVSQLKPGISTEHANVTTTTDVQSSGAAYSNSNEISMYNVDILTGQTSLRCLTCLQQFPSHSLLLRHEKECHDIGKPYQCYICKRNFSIAANLTQHLQMHKNNKNNHKYTCQYCGNNFKVIYKLREHLRVKHNNSINQFTDLELHLQHSGDKNLGSYREIKSNHSAENMLVVNMDTNGVTDDMQQKAKLFLNDIMSSMGEDSTLNKTTLLPDFSADFYQVNDSVTVESNQMDESIVLNNINTQYEEIVKGHANDLNFRYNMSESERVVANEQPIYNLNSRDVSVKKIL